MVFVVKDIIVIFRKFKTILILISFKRYFRILKKSILNLGLRGIVIPGPVRYVFTSAGLTLNKISNRSSLFYSNIQQ